MQLKPRHCDGVNVLSGDGSSPRAYAPGCRGRIVMINTLALVFTEDKDVLKASPDVTISAGFAIRTHLDATSNCSQLIKSEFGVGHCVV